MAFPAVEIQDYPTRPGIFAVRLPNGRWQDFDRPTLAAEYAHYRVLVGDIAACLDTANVSDDLRLEAIKNFMDSTAAGPPSSISGGGPAPELVVLAKAAWNLMVEEQAGPDGWLMARRWAFDALRKAIKPFRNKVGDGLDFNKLVFPSLGKEVGGADSEPTAAMIDAALASVVPDSNLPNVTFQSRLEFGEMGSARKAVAAALRAAAASTFSTSVADTGERAAFERWAISTGHDLGLDDSEAYGSDYARFAWEAWQARGAASTFLVGEGGPADEWISESDRLPDDGQKVLTFNSKTERYNVATFHVSATTEGYNWQTPLFIIRRAEVTHWQPLPAAPLSALSVQEETPKGETGGRDE